jgi:hypothetical protein
MAIIVSDHREPPDPAFLSDIYIDESSQTKNRYLVIGGLSIDSLAVASANDELARLRLPELPHGEMKWGKVSNSKLRAYGRTAKAFFDSAELKPVHFHCLIVDTHHQDHARHNEGSREIGFNKEVYQLASKFARLYPKRLFHLYPDFRDTDQRPEDLRLILNRGRAKKGDPRDWPFRRCHFRDSKSTPLLQLVDLLTGAVAWCVNKHADAENASAAKTKLSAYILRRAGVSDCMRDTAMSGKFTLWHRQLTARGVPRN